MPQQNGQRECSISLCNPLCTIGNRLSQPRYTSPGRPHPRDRSKVICNSDYLRDYAADGACYLSRQCEDSIARGVFQVTGRELPSNRTRGLQSPREWLSPMGRRPQRKRRCWFYHRVDREQRISSSLALDGVGNSPGHESRSSRMKYWEIIADNLSKSGWSKNFCDALFCFACGAHHVIDVAQL